MTPEAKARLNIDARLPQAGWHVCAVAQANIRAALALPKTDGCKTRAADANPFQEMIRQLLLALTPLPDQVRIVAEVDRHLSIIREVESELDANLQRAQALWRATLAKAFDGKHNAE